MKVAIVKPDHIGDFVLSVPAISAIAEEFSDTTLFLATTTAPLARHLFPGLTIQCLDLPHLAKFSPPSRDAGSNVVDLSVFHRVYFLRQDQVLTPAWTRLIAREAILIEDSNEVHESKLHEDAVRRSGIEYRRPGAFTTTKALAGHPKRVGLCLSAGFHANRWPTARWRELGRLLLGEGIAVYLICGPFERSEGEMLARLLGLDVDRRLILGSTDFRAFWDQVQEMDLVIASDGGGAHLCSLYVPILSLFGGSPFRRFAPFGTNNRVLTRLPYCSPCCQYHEQIINGCATIECLTQISAQTVFRAIFEAQRSPGEKTEMGDGSYLFWGVSHAC